jgi:hypothetical protein
VSDREFIDRLVTEHRDGLHAVPSYATCPLCIQARNAGRTAAGETTLQPAWDVFDTELTVYPHPRRRGGDLFEDAKQSTTRARGMAPMGKPYIVNVDVEITAADPRAARQFVEAWLKEMAKGGTIYEVRRAPEDGEQP